MSRKRQWKEADSERVRAAQAAAGLLPGAPSAKAMRDPKHDDIVRACCLFLTQQGCEVFPTYTGPTRNKGFGVMRTGTPDILGWRTIRVPDRLTEALTFQRTIPQFLAVEVKMGRDRETPAQRAILDKVYASGGIHIVVRDSVEDLAKQWKEASK